MLHADKESSQELEREVARLKARVATLKAESRSLKTTLLGIGDALISTDANGKILQMNPTSEALTGYFQTEAIGQPLASIFRIADEVTGKEVESQVMRLLRERDAVNLTNHALLIAKDRSVRPIASCGAPICNVNGDVTGLVLIFRDRAEIVATQKAHRESEALFGATFERSMFGRALIEPDGRVLKVNQAFAGMLGVSIEELQRCHIAEVTHAESVAESKECLRALSSGDRVSYRMNVRYQHRDGHSVFADVGTTLVCDRAGKPLRFVSTIVDTTKNRLTERAMVASEMRYRRLFEAAKDGILIVDAITGKILDANPFILELTGYSHQDFADKCLWEIGPFVDTAASKASFAELQVNGYVRYEDLPLKTRDGRKIDVEFVSNVYQVDGLDVVQCNVRDVTKRKRTEEALRDNESLLSESQRLAHIGSWLWDMNGPLAWSDELYRLHGVSRETFTPTVESLVGLTCPSDRTAMQEWIAACATTERPIDLEYRVAMPDGTVRYFLGRGQRVRGEENKASHVAGTVRDITLKKESDGEKRMLEGQLRASQKMEAIGSLAGGVAHDFNNLLAVILNYTQFAIDAVSEGDPLKSDLKEVMKAAERAAELTHQLLAFGRKQVLQPLPLDLNQTAGAVDKMLRRILGEDISLVQVLAPDLGLTMVDPGQIEQVFMNLVVNCRDAMPDGGILTIETSNVQLGEAFASRHILAKPGAYVRLAISDTGCGMDEPTKARLFEPFFTTKAVGKGTGLGLSTVYGIIKQSGGSIRVMSQIGHGSTFEIYLPRDVSLSAPAVSTLPTACRDYSGKETILVVEDEEALLEVAKRCLETAGYHVLTAPDGDAALLMSAEYAGDIHLLLTDVIMPRMNGKALAQALCQTRPTLKVLFTSGYTDDAIVHHGVLDAGTHFMGKPFTALEMTRKVRAVLDLV